MTIGPSWEDPRQVLRRHSARASRRFSQNFLIDRNAVEAIADAAAGETGPPIVELGAGVGTLTAALLRRGRRVIAVEKDPAMLNILKEELGRETALEVVAGDAAEFDFSEVSRTAEQRIHVAGNLPYSITGLILRNLTDHRRAIAKAVLMVQREVRDRLVASPSTKEYGALTVFVRAAFAVDTLMQLKPTAFHPRPKVKSAVVILEPWEKPGVEVDSAFETVVRAAFQMRRKTLRNALAAASSPDHAAKALLAANIDGARRGETLSVEEFGELAAAWSAAQSD